MSKVKSGRVRGEKVRYPDGVGCAIWSLLNEKDDDSPGMCFDFPEEDLKDIKNVIDSLEKEEPSIYKEDPEEKKKEEEWERKKSTWHYKLLNKLEHIQIGLHPFKWGLGFDRLPFLRNTSDTFVLASGVFRIGPITIAW